jgi:hypothetical protein
MVNALMWILLTLQINTITAAIHREFLKDEYLLSSYDYQISYVDLTNNYFEYEHGQSELLLEVDSKTVCNFG